MKQASKFPIANDKLRASSEIMRALAHPTRMLLLGFIDTHKNVNVSKIYSSLDLEQSFVSQHLGILRKAGVLKAKREGKLIFYGIDYDRLEEVARAADVFAEFVDEDFLPEEEGVEDKLV